MARPRRSLAYPTDHLLAVVDDPAIADRAGAALVAAGFPAVDVTVLRGADEAARLSGFGTLGGVWGWIVRASQFLTMDQMPDFLTYEAALRDGRAVIGVRVHDRPAMLRARDVLAGTGAHFMNFFGRFSTEEIARWSGPELDIPDYLRR